MDATALGILAVRAFVVVTMASFGLQLASGQLAEVLRRPRLVGGVLVVNLLLLPVAAVALCIAMGLSEPVAIGLIVVACAGGSTYGAKLVEVAGGDIRVGVGLMSLLAVVSAVAVAPTAAAMIGLLGSARGTPVWLDPVPILASLLVFQLLPLLGFMLLVRRAPRAAARLRVPAMWLSTVLLVAALIAVVADSGDDLVALGPLPVAAMVVLIALGLVSGYVIGGGGSGQRRATALITGQRSASVAYIAVASTHLPIATATVVAAALVMLVVNLGIALGSRALREGRQEALPVDAPRTALDRAAG